MTEQTDDCTACAADNVGKMRDIVKRKKSAHDFLRQVQRSDGNERQRDFTALCAGGRGEEDQHVNQTGRAHQRAVSAEEDVKQTGNDSSQREHEQQPPAAVALFNDRPEREDQRHVADIMAEGSMAQDMAKQADVSHGMKETGTIHAEYQSVGSAARQHGKAERAQRKQRKAQNGRRIERKDDFAFSHT